MRRGLNDITHDIINQLNQNFILKKYEFDSLLQQNQIKFTKYKQQKSKQHLQSQQIKQKQDKWEQSPSNIQRKSQTNLYVKFSSTIDEFQQCYKKQTIRRNFKSRQMRSRNHNTYNNVRTYKQMDKQNCLGVQTRKLKQKLLYFQQNIENQDYYGENNNSQKDQLINTLIPLENIDSQYFKGANRIKFQQFEINFQKKPNNLLRLKKQSNQKAQQILAKSLTPLISSKSLPLQPSNSQPKQSQSTRQKLNINTIDRCQQRKYIHQMKNNNSVGTLNNVIFNMIQEEMRNRQFRKQNGLFHQRKRTNSNPSKLRFLF